MTEEIVKILIFTTISIGVGTILGNGAVYLFNRLPAKWLCDYGETPNHELTNKERQRIRSVPFKAIFVALFTLVTFHMLLSDLTLVAPVILATFLLLEIGISDVKYSIVPDQLVMLLMLTGIGFVPFHIQRENIWVQPLGAVVGLVVMVIVALLGKLIYKREALGFGDVKLCAAVGFLTGPIGVALIISTGFFVAAIVNIYKLARKKIKIGDSHPVGQYFCAMTLVYFLFVMADNIAMDFFNFIL